MYQEEKFPSSFIIQEYIDRPLLIEGYKFDFRIWSLIVIEKGRRIKAWMYDNGYARLAGVKYTAQK